MAVLNVLDWFFLVLLVLAGLAGFRKGLINSAGGLVAIFFGVLTASACWRTLTDYLQKNYDLITICAGAIQKHLPTPAFDVTEGLVPTIFKNSLYAYQNAPYHVATMIISALVFVLIVIAVTGLITVLFKVVSIPFNWGILGLTNRIGGGLFMLAKQVLILAVVVGLAGPMVTTLAHTGVAGMIDLEKYTKGSLLFPCLENLFQLMGKIIGVN
jgi:uncharacterized membrane protein required for colicin V production